MVALSAEPGDALLRITRSLACLLGLGWAIAPVASAQELALPLQPLTEARVTAPEEVNIQELFRFLPWGNYHVVQYPATASLSQFRQDLPDLQHMLHLTHLRLSVPAGQRLPAQLPRLLNAIHQAGYRVELALASPLGVTALAPLLSHPALHAVLLPVPNASQKEAFQSLSVRLQQIPHLKQGLRFQRFADVGQHHQWLKSQELPLPDFYAYHYRGPLHALHAHVRRGKHYLQKPWQLAELSATDALVSHNQEHEVAWWYRFVYYFSKKYALLPAVAHFYATEAGAVPGLLRGGAETERRTPAYWLTHVYFHLNRIDIDEKKLTRALYTLPGHRQLHRAQWRRFLELYYKLNPAQALPDFISRRRSALFYDYVKREAEESLLTSHFARLQSTQNRVPVRLSFLSALGRFHFLQNLRYGDLSPFPIVGLEAPTLASDFASYRKVSAAEAPWLEQIPRRLEHGDTTVAIETQLLRPLWSASDANFSSSSNRESENHLWVKLKVLGSLPATGLDLQPLALVEKHKGHVFIPEPLFFQFFKHLQSQEILQTVIPFPQDDESFHLRVGLESAREKSPRRLAARVLPGTGRTLQLEIQNPFVERLFLPGLAMIAEQGEHVFVLDTLLPEGLMPLEQRRYTLTLPETFVPQHAVTWHVKAAAYPVIQQSINLDDAFRSDVLGLSAQALIKYDEVLARFARQLSPRQRQSVAERLITLSIQTGDPQTAARFARLLSYPLHKPGLRLAWVRAALNRLDPSWSDLREQLTLAFAETAWQPSLQDYELMAYVEKESGHLAAALERYSQSLTLALAQQNSLEINRLFAILTGLYEAQGRFKQAQSLLLQWQEHPAYQALSLAERQPHNKRLMYFAQRSGDVLAALRYGERYLKQVADPEVMLTLAGLYRTHGQLAKAQAWYERLLHCGGCAQGLVALKELASFYQASQPQRAAAYYSRYLAQADLSPQERQALEETLLELWLRTKNFAAAQTLVQRLLQKCPRCAPLWERQGAISLALKQPERTLTAYERALRLQFTPSRLRQVAYLAFEQQRWRLAASRFEELLRIKPEATVRLNLATAYLKLAQPAQAERVLAPFLSANVAPQNAEQVLALAQLYQKLQASEAAIDLLQGLLTRRPQSSAYAYRLLAALYQSQGNTEQATFWLEQLVARFPTENTLPLFKPEAPRAGRVDAAGRSRH